MRAFLLSLMITSGAWAEPRVVVMPTADQAPTWLRLPVAPGARPGVVVVVSDLATDTDAVAVTVRYRDDRGTWTREQVADAWDGAGGRWRAVVFLVGSVEVLGVSVREIRWSSTREVAP